LQNVKLDEWREKKRKVMNDETGRIEQRKMWTLEYLELATMSYLSSRERIMPRGPEVLVRDEIQRCAKTLVDYRYARERIR
jgi:hypothetical protein